MATTSKTVLQDTVQTTVVEVFGLTENTSQDVITTGH